MNNLKRCGIVLLIIVSALAGAPRTEAANTMSTYVSTPPFLSGGSVDPNLLLLIDNSASMYDLAYVDDQGYCYDDTYNSTNTYVGYFEPASWYGYNLSAQRFDLKTASEASTMCGSATYTNSDVCITSVM